LMPYPVQKTKAEKDGTNEAPPLLGLDLCSVISTVVLWVGNRFARRPFRPTKVKYSYVFVFFMLI